MPDASLDELLNQDVIFFPSCSLGKDFCPGPEALVYPPVHAKYATHSPGAGLPGPQLSTPLTAKPHGLLALPPGPVLRRLPRSRPAYVELRGNAGGGVAATGPLCSLRRGIGAVARDVFLGAKYHGPRLPRPSRQDQYGGHARWPPKLPRMPP